jgi:hypothetical protein
MVAIEVNVKRCNYCGTEKPSSEFYVDRRGISSSRCRCCHGLALRTCRICGRTFIGRFGAKACGRICHAALRPPTYGICRQCGRRYGPVDHLSRKYCSWQCKVDAQTTGRKTFRRAILKARRAQNLVRYFILTGRLHRPTICEECGASARRIEAAHYNYDEPLRVRWLCRSCHVRWDKYDPKHGTEIVSGPNAKTSA